MSEWIEQLARRLVIRRKRDGRCVYDEQAKRELILASREPGVSVSRLARDCGINSNQLSAWVRRYEREMAMLAQQPGGAMLEAGSAPAFVAVQIDSARPQEKAKPVGMQVRLSNGVVVELQGCDMEQART